MRILHWTDSFAPSIGGTEVFVRELARAQLLAGHEVSIVTESIPTCPNEETLEGIAVRRFPFAPSLLSRQAADVQRVVVATRKFRSEFAPDITHVHFLGAAGWFELLSRPRPGPVVTTVHPPVECIRLPVELRRRVLMAADAVIAASRSMETSIAEFEPQLRPRLSCVHCGHRMTPPVPMPPDGEPAVFVGFGRLVEAKGFDVALRAFATFPKNRPCGARLVIAGDGPARASLETLAAELGLQPPQVNFPGWIAHDDMHGLLGTATAVVVPSVWPEPFGLVALEAGIAERPIIASRVGGLPEFVIDGETGWLVPPGDPDALARAFSEVLEDPERAQRLGRNARQKAVREFSIEHCLDRTSEIYGRALRPRSGSSNDATPTEFR